MPDREIRSWLMDMDGVLVHEEQALPGADRFLAALREHERPFLVLTNNSIYTRRDLAARLAGSGLDVPEGSIWTSALATARFIATTPDATGPAPDGPLPATGSVAALISRATQVDPYFVGKPNPLMMRSALNAIEAHSETTAMIGDRMDTDIIAGLEAGLETILVLTGVTSRLEAERYPYRPSRI